MSHGLSATADLLVKLIINCHLTLGRTASMQQPTFLLN